MPCFIDTFNQALAMETVAVGSVSSEPQPMSFALSSSAGSRATAITTNNEKAAIAPAGNEEATIAASNEDLRGNNVLPDERSNSPIVVA